MIDFIATTACACQVLYWLEAGDPAVAREWLEAAQATARTRLDADRLLLLSGLVLFALGRQRRAVAEFRSAHRWLRYHDPILAASACIFIAALVEHERLVMLVRANELLGDGMRQLAQRGDVEAWRRAKRLREQVAAGVDKCLPAWIISSK